MSNLDNVRNNGIPVKVGDVQMGLKFTLNAFADLEEEYGSVEKAFKAMESGSIKSVIKMLFFGLRHNDMSLTERGLGDMIEMSDLPKLTEAIAMSLEYAMPKAPAAAPIMGDTEASPNTLTQKQ